MFRFTSSLLKLADYSNSTVQIIYNSEDTEAILDFTKMVEDEDLFINADFKGRETNPHITVLYGIHERTPDKLDFSGVILPTEVEWLELGKFEAPTHDVLIIKVKKDEVLQSLFDFVNEAYPDNDNSFPNYVPHTTIAYVKKGKADKYIEEYSDLFTGSHTISVVQFAFNDDKWDFNPDSGKQEVCANEVER